MLPDVAKRRFAKSFATSRDIWEPKWTIGERLKRPPSRANEPARHRFSRGAQPTMNAAGMPTVLRTGPCRLYFFSHEPNEPAHVHVDRDDRTAKILR